MTPKATTHTPAMCPVTSAPTHYYNPYSHVYGGGLHCHAPVPAPGGVNHFFTVIFTPAPGVYTWHTGH